MYVRFGTPLFDLCVAAGALILLSPLPLLLGLLVKVMLGSPVLFQQQRPGLQGRHFTLWKFRTMTLSFDSHGRPMADEWRITRFGRFLRSTSLDELPALYCVLRGDMSLVGPRPLLVDYLELYTPEQERRHEVKPGITGLAQVNGRNALNWEDRFVLDVRYVDSLSLWIDLRILLETIWKTIRREGISQLGHATAAPFIGSANCRNNSESS